MDIFREDGHLTAAALRLLAENHPMDELHRLEIAEHLAFCDLCLQRYTGLLSRGELLTPVRSCRESLQRRIRLRALNLLTSRYATAAAAVALALTVVWGSRDVQMPLPPAVTEEPVWAETCGDALDEARARFDNFFDRLDNLRSD